MEQRYIAAIDLGTSKIALAIARITGDNIEVIYYNETESDGIKNSTVSNPMKASLPIQKAICQAEDELKIKIRQVVVGLPRFSVMQQIAEGEIDRHDTSDYIRYEEIEMLKEIALQQFPIEDEKRQVIYGAVAQSFSTDDEIQLSENDVVGTLSSKVIGNFKAFIGNRSSVTALDNVFNRLGIAIAKKYFLPDITAKAVLSEEEKENGVALIDFGAGVTSVTLYSNGIMRHYYSIPFGGSNITRDIRIEASISQQLAENIKLAYGACIPDRLANLEEKKIQIRYDDAPFKEIPVKYLSQIIDAREREIIDAILFSIQESNLKDEIRSGIVITGGGANMANLSNLLKEMSGYNVRIGYPKHRFSSEGVSGIFDCSAVSAIGMILASRDDRLGSCFNAPATVPMPWSYSEPAAPAPVPVAEPQPETPSIPEQAIPEPEVLQPVAEPISSAPVAERPVYEQPQPVPQQPQPVPQQPRPEPASTAPRQPKNQGWKIIWRKINKVGSNVADAIGAGVDRFYISVTEEVKDPKE